MTDHTQRNAEIRERITAGEELTKIATDYNLSSTRIAQIRDGKSGGRPISPGGNKLKRMNSKKLLAAAVEKSRKSGKQWTTTPEGREYMRRHRKTNPIPRRKVAASLSHSSNGKAPQPAQTEKEDSSFEQQVAYVYGRLEAQLEVYAANLGCTFPELAQRLSELLHNKARGKVVGSAHSLSRVRRGSAS